MSRDLLEQLQRTLGDGYDVERELARGGMSRVYLAKELALGRDVVVKALSPDLAADVNFERFSREIKLASRLQHPHIVPLLSAGDSDGTPYYVMPFVDGESLRQRLERSGELPVDEAVRVMREVATALEYAHRNGVVHRDVKPENILLSGGTAVVTDFGVAKAISAATGSESDAGLTTAGIALGTPAYMAPEQASADPTTDHRADIYAWGAVSYELLTGAPPFAGRPTQAMIAAHIAEPVPPIHRSAVPPRLARLIMGALSKRPADRPQSAQELVRELDALTATGLTPAGGTFAGRRSPRLASIGWVVGALVIAAAGFAVWRGRAPQSGSRSIAGAVKRIAVLPFANASGTKDDEYFADGMSEELGAALGKVKGVQVASHSSAFSFKGKDVDVKEVGRKLDVDAVLEGRVRRAGSRLRVTAELSDVSNGLSLWSDSYERDAKDVFAVQNDIARAIATALEVKLSERSSAVAAGDIQGTNDAQAYDLYLRARYFWHKRGSDNLRKAIDLFAGATARDPKFARAFGGVASSYVLLTEYDDHAPPDSHARALSAADSALALDPNVAEAYIARGLVDGHLWKWGEARKAYGTAIALEPSNATAHQWLGELFYSLAEWDSAIVESRKARDLDPLAPVTGIALAYTLYGARRYGEAIREAERVRELAPDLELIPRVMAAAYLQLGDSTKSFAAAKRAVGLAPTQARGLAIYAFIAASTGHRGEALEALKKLKSLNATPLPMLLAYTGLGDRANAFLKLASVLQSRDPALSQYVLGEPMYNSLRGTEEFRRAVIAMGTPKVAEQPRR